jgi:hypothetical protein
MTVKTISHINPTPGGYERDLLSPADYQYLNKYCVFPRGIYSPATIFPIPPL